MAIATYDDVETAIGRPGSLTDAQLAQVEWWLDGIERIIRNRLGALSTLDQDDLRYVEAEAVAEKVRRAGQTESSITVSVDDGSVTRRWETPVTTSDITQEWWDLLAPRRDTAAYSTRPISRRDPSFVRPHARTTY